MDRPAVIEAAAAVVFVLIWSSGFFVARVVRGEVDPALFLAARFVLAAILFAGLALAGGARWPRRALPVLLLAGALISGVSLTAAFWAVAHGMPAAVMALIGALPPLLVALLGRVTVGERVTRRVWLGLLVGVAGVVLVLAPRLASGDGSVGAPLAVGVAMLSPVCLSFGSLIQKSARVAAADLRVAGAVQNSGAALVAGLSAVVLDERHWAGGVLPWASLLWSAMMLSGAATTLLIWMLRRGSATRASALLLLVPPLVAVQTYLVFGEALTAVQLAGFALALGGVWVARR